jgi:hypothetical protein
MRRSKNNVRPETALLLAIAREVVFRRKQEAIPALLKNDRIQWPQVKDSLAYHGLASFAYLSLKEYFSFLPEGLVAALETSFCRILKDTAYLEKRFLALADAFEKKGIALVPIKGMALMEDLYAQCPVRPSVDIDILVQEKDVDRGGAILEEIGFKKDLEGLKESYWRQEQYHFIFTQEKKDGHPFLIAELHWGLDYPRGKGPVLAQIFNRLRDFSVSGRRIKLLSPEDTFFSLALHQRRFGQALALKDVCDMARLLNKYQADFDWEYVLKESKNSRLCSTVYFALYQVKSFFGADIPEKAWAGLEVPFWKKNLIRNFIEHNTFLDNQPNKAKNLYLKAHFLLYDSFWEPIEYILNIPKEQFAKFYGLKQYDKKTDFFYKFRIVFISLRVIIGGALCVRRSGKNRS